MKIAVTGGTGFIGKALIFELLTQGHEIIALVRDVERARRPFTRWLGHNQSPVGIALIQADLETPGAWCDRLANVDAIAHLAGEPVNGKKWDARQKQVIRDSRVESTRTLIEAIGKLAPAERPQVLVTASGIDYYPFAYDETDFDDDEVSESDAPGDTFLARVCRDWEREALAAEPLGLRVACMRTGLVLGAGGGALPELVRPFKFFAGGPVGDGRQWVSWIHLDDVVSAYIVALTDERYRGPINMVTASIRNRDFSRALGRAVHRPSWIPAPKFAVRAMAGKEFAESILKGRRVIPAKLRELGFAWKHPTLDGALAAALET